MLAIIGLAGFLSTVITQWRSHQSKKMVEEAEQAGRLLDLMEKVDLGGSTPQLDTSEIRGRHELQLHRLQQVVRLGVADFTARALRKEMPWMFVAFFITYGILLGVAGAAILEAATTASDDDRLGLVVSGLLICVLTLACFTISAVSIWRRWIRWSRQTQAGINVSTARQAFRSDWRQLRQALRLRKQRRSDDST